MWDDDFIRRRWYHFGRGTIFGFATSLALLWWVCAKWPVTDTIPGALPQQGPRYSSDAELRLEGTIGAHMEPVDVPIERPPTRAETASRVLIGAVALTGVWLFGLAVVTWETQRRSNRGILAKK